jgi:hypothetical protein
VLGAVAAAVIIGVVITRATSGDSARSNTSLPVSAKLIHGGNLGAVNDEQQLRAKLEPELVGTASSTSPRSSDEPRCAAVAHKLQPAGAVRVYEATATWKGAAADLFGFSQPGAPATSSRAHPTPTRVYVLARDDCRLLVFQSFAP